MSLSILFLIIALILFVIAAIPAVSSKFNLIAIGLAFVTAATLAGAGVL